MSLEEIINMSGNSLGGFGKYDRYLANDSYYTAMDKPNLNAPTNYSDPQRPPEEPIYPANKLGITVVDRDPQGRNLLQTTQAAIRKGVGNIQVVMSTSNEQAIGGGFKRLGKDMRQAIREAAEVAGVTIDGTEINTGSVSNLSGFNMQRGNIDEDKRQKNMQEVKDAINFTAEVAGGGGIDYWSQEYARNIHDADWNTRDGKWKDAFEGYKGEGEMAIKYLVDDRSGQMLTAIRQSSIIYEPVWDTDKDGNFLDVEGKPIDFPEPGSEGYDEKFTEALLLRVPKWDGETMKFKSNRLTWEDIKKNTEHYNEKFGLNLNPEEYAYRVQMENKLTQARGQSLFYTRSYESEKEELDVLLKKRDEIIKFEEELPKDQVYRILERDPVIRMGELVSYVGTDAFKMKKPSELVDKRIKDIKHSLKHIYEASSAADAQAEQLAEDMRHVKSLSKFAYEKSVNGLAELGIYAMRQTNDNPDVTKPLHVGPEIGWPTAFGGHPEEFVGYIKKARDQFVQKLTNENEVDLQGNIIKDDKGEIQKNEYYDSSISKEHAKKLASDHISGMFDTGHMGMWFEHFKPIHPRETEKDRLKRFNEWYMEMTELMAKENVVGGIQVVDTATGGHAHLPPGQGILPIKDSIVKLKQGGFDGFVVSEGHEEEQMGEGRILYETWKHFGAHVGPTTYDVGIGGVGPMTTWNQMHNANQGYQAPPFYIVGAYSPSNEWKLWSEVPFE